MSTRKYTCKYCNAGFNDRSNKYRHENKYCREALVKAAPSKRKKVTVTMKSVLSSATTATTAAAAVDPNILKELQELRERVSVIENAPRYNNWIIVGSDMFNDMIDRYGRKEAVNFLTKSAVSGDSIDVIKKFILMVLAQKNIP